MPIQSKLTRTVTPLRMNIPFLEIQCLLLKCQFKVGRNKRQEFRWTVLTCFLLNCNVNNPQNFRFVLKFENLKKNFEFLSFLLKFEQNEVTNFTEKLSFQKMSEF